MTTPARASRVEGDFDHAGTHRFLSAVEVPDDSFGDAEFNGSDPLTTPKMQHRHVLRHGQKDGTDVVSETQVLYVAGAAGTVARVEVRPTTAPDGGDKQYTIDVQKASDASGSWSSLLTGAITLDDADTDDTLVAGTLIATPTYADGDAIRVVVTASGSTGDQGQGFGLAIVLNENP